jgi:hypothetical protein
VAGDFHAAHPPVTLDVWFERELSAIAFALASPKYLEWWLQVAMGP